MDAELGIINFIFVAEGAVTAQSVGILGIFVVTPVNNNIKLIVPCPVIHEYGNSKLLVLGIHQLNRNIGYIGPCRIVGKKSDIGSQDPRKPGAQGITNGRYNGKMVFNWWSGFYRKVVFLLSCKRVVSSEVAVDELINLLKENNEWVEPDKVNGS